MSNIATGLRKIHALLVDEIVRLQRQADNIRETICYLEEKEKQPSLHGTLYRGRGRPPKPPGVVSPLVQAIIRILLAHGGIMHRRDILSALESDGIRLSGDTPAMQLNLLGTYLSLNKNWFEPATRPGDGRWRLKDQQDAA